MLIRIVVQISLLPFTVPRCCGGLRTRKVAHVSISTTQLHGQTKEHTWIFLMNDSSPGEYAPFSSMNPSERATNVQ